MKYFKRILISFLALIVIGVIVVKVFVGAINVPVVAKEINPHVLSARIQVPPGFEFNVYAADVPNARMLRFTRTGDLLVSTPGNDQVLLLTSDKDGDGKYDRKKILLDKKMIPGFKDPHGMDFFMDDQQQSWLYVAESESVGRVRFDHDKGEIVGDYEPIIKDLPGGGNHWKKSLRFGPDRMLYVTMGSSCNVCIEEDKRRATMMRYQPDGSSGEVFASGLRNSEGFDWSTRDGALYATDNGRDLLGDNFPPCEFNKIEQGGFYGWPFANGSKVKDPDYGEDHAGEIAQSIAPAHAFQAHNAPLGITFLRDDNVPKEYKQAALVALHGSWNRSKKDGYKVVSLQWTADGHIVEKDFFSGFLKDDQVIGRPVDVAENFDGSIYVSDDFAGRIYRITYKH